MQLQTVAFLLFVACVYSAAASVFRTKQHQPNTRQMHPLLRKRNSETNMEPPKEEMCFTINHLQALKDQFASYIDKNRDERASREEIMEYLMKYNTDVTDRQVDTFISRRDKDGDGYVDFIPDYLREVSSPNYDVETAKEWFQLEDTNGNGYVSRDELIAIAVKVGMPLDEAEKTVDSFYMSADADGDDRLSWEEYVRLFIA